MKQLISHIEFLLHKHNCVIVPELGGFVINKIPAQKDGLSTFRPPICELVFNGDLTHNDGLLVESYMRTDEISFEAATQKIEKAAREIKRILREEKTVHLGDLGCLNATDEQRFVFCAGAFIRPEHFGMSAASLRPIIQIQPKTEMVALAEKAKNSIIRRIGIGAAAAGIAGIMLMFSIQDTPLHYQSAQIFSDNGLFGAKIEKTKENLQTPSLQAETTESAKNISASSFEEPAALSDTHPRYYIVTGVYQVRKFADDMVTLLQSEGFSPSTIERIGRIDVCAASFSTRQEAEQNLKHLKNNFSNHRDAWVLKR